MYYEYPAKERNCEYKVLNSLILWGGGIRQKIMSQTSHLSLTEIFERLLVSRVWMKINKKFLLPSNSENIIMASSTIAYSAYYAQNEK